MASVFMLERLVVRVEAETSQYMRSMDAVERKALSAGDAVEHFGARLTMGVTVPLTAMGVAVTREFSRFDKAITESLAIMDDVSPRIQAQMEDIAKSTSLISPSTPIELAEGYYSLASAGLKAEESIAAIPLVQKFATAGAMKLSRSTDLLTGSVTALGLRGKDAVEMQAGMARVANGLVAVNNMAIGTVEDFADALENKAAASMRMLNMEVEEGLAVLAAYAEQGIQGRLAGSKFEIMTRNLQKAVGEEGDAWKELGIEVYNAQGGLNDFADIMGQLERVIKPMSVQMRDATFSVLGFDARAVQAIKPLIGMSEEIRRFEKGIRGAETALDDVARKQMESFANQIQVLINNLHVLGAELGEMLAPTLEELASLMQSLIQGFRGLDAWVKKAIANSLAFAAAIGPSLLGIAFLVKALKAIGSLTGLRQVASGAEKVSGVIRNAAKAAERSGTLIRNTQYAMTAASKAAADEIAIGYDRIRAKSVANTAAVRAASTAVTTAKRAEVAAERELALAQQTGLAQMTRSAQVSVDQARALRSQAEARLRASMTARAAFQLETEGARLGASATQLMERAKLAEARASQSQAAAKTLAIRAEKAAIEASMARTGVEVKAARAAYLARSADAAAMKAANDAAKSTRLMTDALKSQAAATHVASYSTGTRVKATAELVAAQTANAGATALATTSVAKDTIESRVNLQVREGVLETLRAEAALRESIVAPITTQTEAIVAQNAAMETQTATIERNIAAFETQAAAASTAGMAASSSVGSAMAMTPTKAGTPAMGGQYATIRASQAASAAAAVKAATDLEAQALRNLNTALVSTDSQSIKAAQSQLVHAQKIKEVALAQRILTDATQQQIRYQKSAENFQVAANQHRGKTIGFIKEYNRAVAVQTAAQAKAISAYKALTTAENTLQVMTQQAVPPSWIAQQEKQVAKLAKEYDKARAAIPPLTAVTKAAAKANAEWDQQIKNSQLAQQYRNMASVQGKSAAAQVKSIAQLRREQEMAARAVALVTEQEVVAHNALNTAMASGNRTKIASATHDYQRAKAARMVLEAQRAQAFAERDLTAAQARTIQIRRAQATADAFQVRIAAELTKVRAAAANASAAYDRAISKVAARGGRFATTAKEAESQYRILMNMEALRVREAALVAQADKAAAAATALRTKETAALATQSTAAAAADRARAATSGATRYAGSIQQAPMTDRMKQEIQIRNLAHQSLLRYENALKSGTALQQLAAVRNMEYVASLKDQRVAADVLIKSKWGLRTATNSYVDTVLRSQQASRAYQTAIALEASIKRQLVTLEERYDRALVTGNGVEIARTNVMAARARLEETTAIAISHKAAAEQAAKAVAVESSAVTAAQTTLMHAESAARMENIAATESQTAAEYFNSAAKKESYVIRAAAITAQRLENLNTAASTAGIKVNTANLFKNHQIKSATLLVTKLHQAVVAKDTAQIIIHAAALKTETGVLWLSGLAWKANVASIGAMKVLDVVSIIQQTAINLWIGTAAVMANTIAQRMNATANLAAGQAELDHAYMQAALAWQVNYGTVAATQQTVALAALMQAHVGVGAAIMATIGNIPAALAAITVMGAVAITAVVAIGAALGVLVYQIIKANKEWKKAQEDMQRLQTKGSEQLQEQTAAAMELANQQQRAADKAKVLKAAIDEQKGTLLRTEEQIHATKEAMKGMGGIGTSIAGLFVTTDLKQEEEKLKGYKALYDEQEKSLDQLGKAFQVVGGKINEATGNWEISGDPETVARNGKLTETVEDLTKKLQDQKFTLDMLNKGYSDSEIEILKVQNAFPELAEKTFFVANSFGKLEEVTLGSMMSMAKRNEQMEKARSQTMELTKSIKEEIIELQAQKLGFEGKEIDVYKLRMQDATGAIIKQTDEMLRLLTIRKEMELASEISKVEKELQKSIDTFGMSSEQIKIWELQQKGATDAAVAHAKALAESFKTKEEDKKLDDEAKKIKEEMRTPMQKFIDEEAKLRKMLDKGFLSWDQYQKGVAKAKEEMGKMGQKTDEMSKKQQEMISGLTPGSAKWLDMYAKQIGYMPSTNPAMENAKKKGKPLFDRRQPGTPMTGEAFAPDQTKTQHEQAVEKFLQTIAENTKPPQGNNRPQPGAPQPLPGFRP